MHRRTVVLAATLAVLLAGASSARAEFQNFLSPGMSYDTMALANASFILSQAQQNTRLQDLALDLRGQRPAPRQAAPSAAP